MTDNKYTLRRAGPDDAEVLDALAFCSKASNGYDSTFMEACRDELSVPADDLASGKIWIVQSDDIILGFLHMTQQGDRVELEAMYVAPAYKGAGAGRVLWGFLEDKARAVSATSIELDADPTAQPFYAAMGCEVIGEAPSGSIPGRMLPRMRKWL